MPNGRTPGKNAWSMAHGRVRAEHLGTMHGPGREMITRWSKMIRRCGMRNEPVRPVHSWWLIRETNQQGYAGYWSGNGARVGPEPEWHLLLGNCFRHAAFQFGPGLGQPVVLAPPPLPQAGLVPVRPAPDPVGGDRGE